MICATGMSIRRIKPTTTWWTKKAAPTVTAAIPRTLQARTSANPAGSGSASPAAPLGDKVFVQARRTPNSATLDVDNRRQADQGAHEEKPGDRARVGWDISRYSYALKAPKPEPRSANAPDQAKCREAAHTPPGSFPGADC